MPIELENGAVLFDAREDGIAIITINRPEQRNALTRFGVPIAGFRHPAAETLESWTARLHRFFDTLAQGDVLVVATVHALGRTPAEEAASVAELRQRGV